MLGAESGGGSKLTSGNRINYSEGGGRFMKENEIPKGKRNYFIPGREDVFEQDGKYYIFMGTWAGWQVADKITVFPDGSVSALSGVLNEKAAVAAAGRILKEGRILGC